MSDIEFEELSARIRRIHAELMSLILQREAEERRRSNLEFKRWA